MVNVEASNTIKREVYVTKKELPVVDKNCKEVFRSETRLTVKKSIDPNIMIKCDKSTFVKLNYVSIVDDYYIYIRV